MRSFASFLALACLAVGAAIFNAGAARAEPVHGIAMHGAVELPADFKHLPFVNPDAPKGGRIIFGQAQAFTSINPLIVRGDAAAMLVPYVVQPLMFRNWNEPFALYGLVAKSAEWDPDRTFIEFKLDPAATFSDGKPLTTADVEFTFNLLKEKGRPTQRTAYGKVATVDIKDAQTIRFNFPEAKDRELPLILALMPVLPKHAIDVTTFDQPTMAPIIGSGPYTFDKIAPGTSITLKRNPAFWAKDLPVLKGLYNADELRFDFYRDENAAFEAFRAGLFDIRIETSAARWQNDYGFADGAGVDLIKQKFVSPKGMSGLVFNTRKPVFADAMVRAALTELFDFEAVNKNLFGGAFTRTPSFFTDSDMSFSGVPIDEKEKAILGDAAAGLPPAVMDGSAKPSVSDGSGKDRARLRAAVVALQKAGFTLAGGTMKNANGEPLAFEIFVTTDDHAKLALAYAETAKLIGISAKVRQVESTQYWNSMKEFAFDSTMFTYAASASPGNEQLNRWSSASASRNGSLNYAGVQSPAIDAALQAMLAARERSDFTAALRTLDRLLIAGNYMIPFYHQAETWIAVKRNIGRPDSMPKYQLVSDSFWVKP
jgi:peptide/nickel transport system substrate-binding protein